MLTELVYVARVDADTKRVRIEWANDAFVRITGFHKEELELIPTWPMLVHPKDEEIAIAHRERVFRGEPSSVTMRIVDSRGRTRHIRYLARPYKNIDGVIDRMYVSGHEVTDRVEAEGLIRLQHEALQKFSLCATPEALAVEVLASALKVDGYDMGGVYLRDSATGSYALVAHKGLSTAFVEASSVFDAGSAHAQRIESGQPGFGPYTEMAVEYDEIRWREGLHNLAILPFASGGRIFGALNLASRSNGSLSAERRAVLETLASTTAIFLDRLEAERQLTDSERLMRQSRDHATASEAVKDAMITRISHALRTPLSVVHGITDVLEGLEQPHTLSADDHHQAMQRLQEAVAALQTVADALMDLPQLRYGTLAPRPHRVDLAAIVREVATAHLPHAQRRALALDIQLPSAPVFIETDEDCVRQALIPVIENAMYYTHAGRILVSLVEGDTAVDVCVQDSGCGIPSEHLEDIFSLFFSRHVVSPYKHDGIGLGLPIARMYIEAVGGAISVESTPGTGSTFHLRIPRM